MTGKMYPVGNRIRSRRWIMELLFVFLSLLVLFDISKLLHALLYKNKS